MKVQREVNNLSYITKLRLVGIIRLVSAEAEYRQNKFIKIGEYNNKRIYP